MKVTVTKKDASWEFDANPDESVLYAGLRQGLNLPYECATGTCGSCKARLVKGELTPGWDSAPGKSYIKTERGEFLMCQCSALDDCEIRVPGGLSQSSDELGLPAHYDGVLKNPVSATADVIRFDIKLDRPMRWKAGQFVVVSSPSLDGYRAYSMVNYVDEGSGALELVIKRLPGGKFSNWLFDDVRTDMPLSVFGPLGTAVFEPNLDKDIVCIAGGSGIAGMMSILTHGCQANYFKNRHANLYFGVRTPKDIFFYTELEEMAQQFPETLQITIALSDEAPGALDPQQPANIVMTTGFVHEAARSCQLETDNCMAYVAGPPPMVDAALRDLVVESGYAAEQIRYDKFG